MINLDILKAIDYQAGAENPGSAQREEKKGKQLARYLDIRSADSEAVAIASHIDDRLKEIARKIAARKRNPDFVISPEKHASDFIKALPFIFSHPFKMMNPTATAKGLTIPVTELREKNGEAKGMHSGNAHMTFKAFSYAGDCVYITYGKILTDTIVRKQGRTSLFELAGQDEPLLRDAMGLSHHLAGVHDEIVDAMVDAFRRSCQSINMTRVGSTIKQIHFPASSTEDHLLVIVNHGGLRKAMSDYLDKAESLSTEKVGSKTVRKIWHPTTDLLVGGTKPQNSGEIAQSVNGRFRLLSAAPPRYRKPKGLSQHTLRMVERSGNPFLLIGARRIHLDKPQSPIYRHLSPSRKADHRQSKRMMTAAFRMLLQETMRPVSRILEAAEAENDAFFEKMDDWMKRWVDPSRHPGSISASEYRKLRDLCKNAFLSKVNFLSEGKPQILSDLQHEILGDAITDYLKSA